MSEQRTTRSSTTTRVMNSTKFDDDDWETDPDFVRDMDEIDQRWGSKRTVGKIDMNELIDEVRKDHKILREKFDHPSQRDHSEGFGGKFGIQHDRKDESAADYDYHEKLSKHTSQEISRKVITSSSITKGGGVSDAKKIFMERSEDTFKKSRSPTSSRTSAEDLSAKQSVPKSFKSTSSLGGGSKLFEEGLNRASSGSPRFEESSTSKKIIKEERSSSSSSSKRTGAKEMTDMPAAFKSIQDKINAFKKEFEDIENKVTKKSDLSKVIKKTTNLEESNVEYVARLAEEEQQQQRQPGSATYSSARMGARPTSTSPSSQRDMPKTSIKSLSKKFETLCREDSEDFKRKTDAKRREFFDQIKNQVRETRKELDGFDAIDDDEEVELNFGRKSQERLDRASPASQLNNQSQASSKSPASRPSSRLSGNSPSNSALGKPKIYTRREVTQEEVVSRLVKENDKVIENETKRNVQRSSSCHGSSDEDEPSSIKYIDRQLRNSPTFNPQARTESPVERVKRENPIVEPETKGAGLMARTLYDYQAVESDELSFDVDDLITSIEKVDKGWYKGTITYKDGHKQVGLFPANYVRLLNDEGEY